MANYLYDNGRQAFLEGSISWNDDNIRCILIDNEYYSPTSTDEFLSDIPSEAQIATSDVLSGKSTTAGMAGANSISFIAVRGPTCEALVIYQDSGDDATSRLIAHMDTATGLPITPNGSDVVINWNYGRIFKI